MGEIIDFASRSREVRAKKCENCKWHIPRFGACAHPDGGYWWVMEIYIKTGGYCPLWQAVGREAKNK
jgi:hypothetical protein|nr:MAG TPA: High-potential iron-sulfur protein-SULFUR CLUSTER, ELECTRON TRANSPORT, Iron [Caudoviricetes sp.]